jgi:hypothetical protein
MRARREEIKKEMGDTINNNNNNNSNNKTEYVVHCHCGRVRGKFQCDRDHVVAWDCNCSDCSMRRNVHIIIPQDDFTLDMKRTIPPPDDDNGGDDNNDNTNNTKDQETLLHEATILYTWGTHTAKRYFCKTCGILPWYRPRSNPDGYAITLNCVDWRDGGAGTGTGGADNNDDDSHTQSSSSSSSPSLPKRKPKPAVEIKFYDGQNWEDSHTLTNIGQCSKT